MSDSDGTNTASSSPLNEEANEVAMDVEPKQTTLLQQLEEDSEDDWLFHEDCDHVDPEDKPVDPEDEVQKDPESDEPDHQEPEPNIDDDTEPEETPGQVDGDKPLDLEEDEVQKDSESDESVHQEQKQTSMSDELTGTRTCRGGRCGWWFVVGDR